MVANRLNPRRIRCSGMAASLPAPPPRVYHCPPLPLEIWTQIMRTLVHSEDLPELWTGLRLLSHTLKAAIETAFVDEHLARLRGCLYVGDPQQLEIRRPWSQPGAKRIVPLPLALSHLSPDRRRAYFISVLHRDDPALTISPSFADCTDNTVVAEWLRSARGPPPPGKGPTQGHLRLNVGPDTAWSHWKHHVISSDSFVVESRAVTFKDDSSDGAGGDDINSDSRNDEGNDRNYRGKGVAVTGRAIGLQVDRARCEVSLNWTALVSYIFSRPRRTFGHVLQS
ncbi:hypothetical protein AAE478_008246 [Parahypoxylon ruwenzoriense]